jgi:drug/metabolite transporter (DMT)-like permease
LIQLIVASMIWSFSFGIIKKQTAGHDPAFSTMLRLGLALLVFLPLLRQRFNRVALQLVVIGAVQYGLMYLLLFQSFRYLEAYEVALFTILTPFWVLLLADPKHLTRGMVPVILAIGGGAVVRYSGDQNFNFDTGFLYLQLSNLCFAFGQVQYRRLLKHQAADASPRTDANCFAWLFLGGFLVGGARWLWLDMPTPPLTMETWGAYAYLGIIASGFGFFLWNSGARQVTASRLAAANNLKIPTAVAVSLLIFGEQIDVTRLAIGAGLIAVAMILKPKSATA